MTAIVILEVTIAISLKSLLVCKLSMKLIIQPVKLLQAHWTMKIMLLYLHQLFVLDRRARAVVVQHLC